MRLTVSDVVSPSYFVATAAVALGFFKQEGVDIDLAPTPPDASQALRDGDIDFIGGSPYLALPAFPGWQGGKVLCALAHYTYWFLAIRADIPAQQGDLSAVKGRRISAAAGPGMALEKLLAHAGIDLERDNVQIVPPPHHQSGNWAWDGVRAIEDNLADAYWGNGMRADLGVHRGIVKILVDVRRGDGPPAARRFTFPALVTTDRLMEQHPDVAAGAVRAIVKTQQALRADPTLATEVGRRLFPAEETALIAGQIARDVPFYDADVTEDMIAGASEFARDLGLLSGAVPYEQLAAVQFKHLWK